MTETIPLFSYQMNPDHRIQVTCAVCHHVVARADDECDLKAMEEAHDCRQLLLPRAS